MVGRRTVGSALTGQVIAPTLCELDVASCHMREMFKGPNREIDGPTKFFPNSNPEVITLNEIVL